MDTTPPIVWVLPDGSIISDAEHTAATEVAALEDQLWFEDHPDAYGRLRDPIEGEFAPLGLCESDLFGVLVRQVRRAWTGALPLRLVEPLATGLRPGPVLLDWDEVSGEVFSLHTDYPSTLDDLYAALCQYAQETTPPAEKPTADGDGYDWSV
jgi:hypothetical protein